MNAEKRMVVGVVAGLMLAGGALAQTPAPVASPVSNPEKSRAEYNAIVSHLDAGGDLMVVANTDGVLEELADTLRGFAQLVPSGGPSGNNKFAQAMDRLPGFLKSSGLYAVDGFGLSVVPRADGLNDMKGFVYRDPAAAQLPFWQGIIGGAPKRLAALDYLPADTVAVRAGTADPRQLWKLINDAVRQVGGPDAAQAFDAGLGAASQSIGTNLNSVIASLDSEQFVALQLSSTQTVQLPGEAPGQEGLSIPAPALLLGCAVRDATLSTTIRRALQQAQVPILIGTNGATMLYTIGLPVPLPFPVAPTFAVHRGMFLFGSTAEVVKNAIAGAEGAGGSHVPTGLQKAFGTTPNNGFAFIDRRFSDTLMKVQSYYMKRQSPDGGAAFQAMLQRQQLGQVALVFVNEKDGISVRGMTAMNGRQLILGMTMMPVATVAMMSAIAIPSFMRSRNDSRNSACINNLRLIDHAKQQWAVAENKAETDVPTAADLVKYFKNGHMPVCPEGGTYSINAVGEAPTCSKPGHALRQ